jgi:hypothetical protein
MTNLQELIIGTAAPNDAITNFPVTTNLVPSDVVVVCCSRGAGSPSTTVTTAGVTWTLRFNDDANTRAQMHTATGITGPINVAIKVFAPLDPSRTVIYVIRGLTNPAAFAIQQSGWDTTGGADLTPKQPFGPGQFVIGECISTNPEDATWPTGTPPADGWTIDDMFLSGGPSLFMAHAIGGPGEPGDGVNIGISNGANNSGAAVMVFGEATGPAATVWVEEFDSVATSGNTPVNMTIETDLLPTDFIVLISTASVYTDSGVTPTGLGGGWTKAINMQPTSGYNPGRNAMGFTIWTKTGRTGGGTITLTGYQYTNGRTLVYVIRGLATPTLSPVWVEQASAGNVAAGTQIGPADLGVPAPAMAFLEGRWGLNFAALIAPASNTLPAPAEWNNDYTGGTTEATTLSSSRTNIETDAVVRGRIQAPAGTTTTMLSLVFVVGNAAIIQPTDNGMWGVQL